MNAREKLLNYGYDDVVYLTNYGYDDALIGVSTNNCAVYDFDLMVRSLVEKEGFELDDAIEFIEYNTVRSLPYMGRDAPIILYRLIDEL